MFAVGVDVSNAKSTVAVLQSKTKVAIKPFEVQHTAEGFAALAGKLNELDGETRIVMEHTGRYYESFAMTGQEFSYENYTIMQNAAIFDISVDELPMLNPDFKRYVKILHDHDIHTTTDMMLQSTEHFALVTLFHINRLAVFN